MYHGRGAGWILMLTTLLEKAGGVSPGLRSFRSRQTIGHMWQSCGSQQNSPRLKRHRLVPNVKIVNRFASTSTPLPRYSAILVWYRTHNEQPYVGSLYFPYCVHCCLCCQYGGSDRPQGEHFEERGRKAQSDQIGNAHFGNYDKLWAEKGTPIEAERRQKGREEKGRAALITVLTCSPVATACPVGAVWAASSGRGASASSVAAAT